MSEHHSGYYLPKPSYWPLVASFGLFTTLVGAANWIHLKWYGPYIFFTGASILVFMMFGWFGTVIRENQAGLYDHQVDRAFRWSMGWFIFSEVCFFGAFFGALFFTRFWSVPLLGGEMHPMTHILLWPNFKATWGLATLNTLVLLTSGVTVTWAHWALRRGNRKGLIIGLTLTVLLGITFLCAQAYEYHEAYTRLGLTLNAGIYGTTFFMLTGFQGAHVTIGTIMLIVILIRSIRGHFSEHNHFAFEAVSWYWHFVGVVWLFLFLFLFIFVYWL